MKLPLESARLTAWSSAFLDGAIAPDDLAEHAVIPGAMHRVVGLGGPDGQDTEPLSLPMAFAELRRRGARRAWLVWPVPGDASGLPGPAEVNRLALAAGGAVVVEPLEGGRSAGAPGAASLSGTNAGLTLVPSQVGERGVVWTVLPAADVRSTATSLADADRRFKTALREATDALEDLDVARTAEEQVEHLEALRRRPPPVELPRGFSPRAHALLDTTQRLAGMLAIATVDDGAAVSRTEASMRAATLRELAHAVRHGFVAAVNALSEESVRSR